MADIKDVIQRQEYDAAHRAPHGPEVDDEITVELPDERTRGLVERVLSPTRVIVRLVHHTTGIKSHNYKKGDFVGADFRKGPLGIRGWYAISQAELDDAIKAIEPREMTKDDL